jgi:hypothetical protein
LGGVVGKVHLPLYVFIHIFNGFVYISHLIDGGRKSPTIMIGQDVSCPCLHNGPSFNIAKVGATRNRPPYVSAYISRKMWGPEKNKNIGQHFPVSLGFGMSGKMSGNRVKFRNTIT